MNGTARKMKDSFIVQFHHTTPCCKDLWQNAKFCILWTQCSKLLQLGTGVPNPQPILFSWPHFVIVLLFMQSIWFVDMVYCCAQLPLQCHCKCTCAYIDRIKEIDCQVTRGDIPCLFWFWRFGSSVLINYSLILAYHLIIHRHAFFSHKNATNLRLIPT